MANFEGAKENIQPLAAGRNAEQLEVAINAESQEELLQQRRQFEVDIVNYVGDDPLDLWFEYVSWVEQSYPKSGKESALDELLKKCLATFEKDSRYAQDPRFIRLFIKYIDTKKNPHLYYTKLYNSGVGTMVADLYIAWAHYFDILDDFEQAKTVYQKGLDARAAPIDQLKQIYERFQFSVGQRIIHKEEYRQEFLTNMEAQRNAFTSLRSLKRSKVGSIRTGSAVKSFTPGQVKQSLPKSALSSSSNAPLQVYEGSSKVTVRSQPPQQQQQHRSVVEEIEHSMVENHIEPGPWSKASSRKSVFDNVSHRSSALKMAILEDDIEQPPIKFGPLPKDNGSLAINWPKNFARKNEPQTPFVVPAYVEDAIEINTLVRYPKPYLHPNARMCFQLEELRHYNRLKQRNISNDFTKERDQYWGIGNTVAARCLPNFPRKNQPQTEMKTERPDITSIPSYEHFECDLEKIYPVGTNDEISLEEQRRDRRIRESNEAADMEETMVVKGRMSFGVNHFRKSIANTGRKSIVPLANDKASSARRYQPVMEDSSSDMDIDDLNEVDNHKREKVSAIVPAVQSVELPTNKWSIFKDDEPNASKMAFPKQKPNEEVQSPVIFSASKSVGSSVYSSDTPKGIFALPQRPLSRSVHSAERRPLESHPMKTPEIDTPSTSKLAEHSSYPIGPQTGAVKKSIRKSTITEHSVQYTVNNAASSNNETASKVELDYSLCTQAFNINLAEQMVSTPVSAHRTDPLAERIRSQDTQPLQPLKSLSTIMETTEGSTHTTSTKSSTQFSSPEDDDLSKRTKVAGATVCYSDYDATGTYKNESKHQSRSGPIDELPMLHSNVAASASYSCNVEKTLPAIQMSLVTHATPVPQKKTSEATTSTARDVPAKNYPFPIFEDTQTTPTTPTMSEGQCKNPHSIHLAQSIFTAEPEKESSTEGAEIVNRISDARFNQSSLWIKDEAKSFTLTDSVAEESFALPSSHQSKSLAQLSRMIVAEDFESFRVHQVNDNPQMDDTVAEESFALPNICPRESICQPSQPYQVNDSPQMDVTVAEESFALPKIRPRKSIFQPSRPIVSEANDEQPIECSTADETFGFPLPHAVNASESSALRRRTDVIGTDTNFENSDEPQANGSMADESFALPINRQSESVAQPNHSNRTLEPNESTESEEEEDEEDEEEEEVILVPDETMIDSSPKIVNVQSLANQNGDPMHNYELTTRISISLSEDEFALFNKRSEKEAAETADAALTAGAACDQSIYFKHNSISVEPSWIENKDEPPLLPEVNVYQHEKVNLEESRIVIDTKLADKEAVDPFDEMLKMAILQEQQFIQHLEQNESSELVCTVPPVTVKRTIPFKGTHFDVLKCIGHGAYGRVYHVKYAKNGATYAVKKEMPANLWEYYILREVRRRVVGNLSGYMRIDMAIVGNDGSLLFSEFSPYGTLLDVCNRVFTSIQNNVNETIVFILAYQMLDLIERLHQADILHLDLKPDNFLVMKPMSSNPQDLFIQLIDFGNAIDLRNFPTGQQFNAALETKHFVCIEMLENRPWIHQPDLFCLAATIHSVLFGRYMEVRKIGTNFTVNIKVPRYFNGDVWSRFFNEMINIPVNTSPNLEAMKRRFYEAIVSDKKLDERIVEFNRFIH